MKTWNTMEVEKAGWPRGEWDNEPDKAHWIDELTGLDCLIVRNNIGGLCGYVGIPGGHKYFEKHYDAVDVDVHGGLTFSDKSDESEELKESEGICHPKKCAANNNVWWLGFDCVHGGDLVPSFLAHRKCLHRPDATDIYRGFDYVKSQVEELAKQLCITS